MDHSEYYKTAHWQKIRKQRLEIDNYTCRTCGEKGDEYTLQVHHIRYNNFAEDVNKDLITLCSDCHQAITDSIRRRRYQGQKINIQNQTYEIVERTKDHGLENSEIQIDLRIPSDSSQRPISESPQSIGSTDEENYRQTFQDNRRP